MSESKEYGIDIRVTANGFVTSLLFGNDSMVPMSSGMYSFESFESLVSHLRETLRMPPEKEGGE